MEDDDWLVRLAERFRRSDCAILGLTSNASVLREDGCGIQITDSTETWDFVDASLLAIRADVARRFGLFSSTFDYFYFEDVDLCLRYRQIGLKIELLDLAVRHERSASARLLPQYTIESVLNRNRARFFDRWENYLKTRKLPNRMAVRFDRQDRQLQVASLPAIFGLLAEYPTAVLDVWGVHEQIASLFEHPRIRRITWWQQARYEDYIRSYVLGASSDDERPLITQIGEQLSTDADIDGARSHLESLADCTREKDRALVFVARLQPLFDGRQPSAVSVAAADEALREKGLTPTWCTDCAGFEIDDLRARVAGEWKAIGQCSGLDVLNDVARADIIVSSDSWISELAQLMGRRTFLWLGAVSDKRAVWNRECAAAFQDDSLDCLGCHERYGQDEKNTCLRGDIACMRAELVERFCETLGRFCAGESITSARPIPASRSRAYAASTQLNLQAWPRTAAGSVLVLTPVNPMSPREMVEHARGLAERAISGMRGSRIVYDEEGEAPLRGVPHVDRQEGMAKLRQEMLERHLGDEQWVFWVDADIVEYPADLIDQLIARAEGGIAAPLVLMEGKVSEPISNPFGFGPGRFYDVAGFVENGRWARFVQPYFDQLGPVYNLDSVGSCYLVNAELYRQGAKHVLDPASRTFLQTGVVWSDDTINRNQMGVANSFTEHY
ncbi:MAG: hypothetical protein M3Z30_11915, partial [Gemmatimonadota bacterium]|nr:hypothetical protein [Gemmatimonadota bacterium]